MVHFDEALQALRRELSGRECEFATVLEVADGGADGFLVRVRAGRRLHPHTLVVAADATSLALDHATGEPLSADDARLWAQGLVLWLEEELDTGVLRWGQRVTLEDGTPAIDPTLETDVADEPWEVSEVPLERPTRAGQRRLRRLMRRAGKRRLVILGDRIPLGPDPAPGGSLDDAGFDVRAGRAAYTQGRLIAWLQLYADDRGGSPPVGQLVVSWRDESAAAAQLEALERTPPATQAAVESLMLTGIHEAADAGARNIEHRLDGADALRLGLPWQTTNGVMRLDAAEVP